MKDIRYTEAIIVQNRQKHGISLTAFDSLPILPSSSSAVFPEVTISIKRIPAQLNEWIFLFNRDLLPLHFRLIFLLAFNSLFSVILMIPVLYITMAQTTVTPIHNSTTNPSCPQRAKMCIDDKHQPKQIMVSDFPLPHSPQSSLTKLKRIPQTVQEAGTESPSELLDSGQRRSGYQKNDSQHNNQCGNNGGNRDADRRNGVSYPCLPEVSVSTWALMTTGIFKFAAFRLKG